MGPQPAHVPPTVRFPLAKLLDKYRSIRAFSHELKHVFSVNPLRPTFQSHVESNDNEVSALGWISFAEGIYEIGSNGSSFFYDNERPRHRVFLEPFALDSRLITNEEYRAFMGDGGYERPDLWLSEGWDRVKEERRPAPGAIGEYNGKFMCNQFVLRGGSCATSRDHVRKTYRNFFPAHTRWQFSGLRLAREVSNP